MSEKRYCLEKLVDYHRDTGTETWKPTKRCSDNPEALRHFMGHTYRIVDTHTGRVYAKNFDPELW
jgi:hypothetical protein